MILLGNYLFYTLPAYQFTVPVLIIFLLY